MLQVKAILKDYSVVLRSGIYVNGDEFMLTQRHARLEKNHADGHEMTNQRVGTRRRYNMLFVRAYVLLRFGADKAESSVERVSVF